MHVDGARLDVDVRAPYRIKKLLAREHAAGVLHEVVEQPEFRRAEVDVCALPGDAVRDAVDLDIAHRDAVFLQSRPDAAEHGAHACHQFCGRKGLGHIIVRARIKPADPVALLAARGEHDDRKVGIAPTRAHPAADLDAADFRQHPVQQQQVRRALVEHDQRFLAVPGYADIVIFLAQIVEQELRYGFFVFCDQHIGLHGSAPFCRRGPSGA